MSACLYCGREAGAAGLHDACIPRGGVAAPVPAPRFALEVTPGAGVALSGRESTIISVRVTDIALPFDSMIILLVKLALAAIPAAIVLGVLGALVVAVVRAFAHR